MKAFTRCAGTRNFDVPDTLRGRRVLLHFGAVDYRAEVWLNGPGWETTKAATTRSTLT